MGRGEGLVRRLDRAVIVDLRPCGLGAVAGVGVLLIFAALVIDVAFLFTGLLQFFNLLANKFNTQKPFIVL